MESEAMLWVSLLLQWVFLFAILTMLFFPAFRFRKLARAHNKKGWVYFVVGLGVGIVALQLGNLVLFCLRYLKPSEGQLRYLWIPMFVPWYIFYRFFIGIFEKAFREDRRINAIKICNEPRFVQKLL